MDADQVGQVGKCAPACGTQTTAGLTCFSGGGGIGDGVVAVVVVVGSNSRAPQGRGGGGGAYLDGCGAAEAALPLDR